MLDIGIVGIGGIAQKAYLPFMRQLPDIRWHLFTRNSETLAQTESLFGQSVAYDSLDELVETHLDGVFIHSATVAHFETAKSFLEKGIPVYMDKPLTESYDQTEQLYRLAKERDTFLVAGFNRRFAPKVELMKEQKEKTYIRVEKNDGNRPGPLTFKLFDFFIHPLDTALYLADEEPYRGEFHYHTDKEGLLTRVQVTMETPSTSLVVSMNLQSGSRKETMEVQTPAASYQLDNLEELSIYQGNRITNDRFGSWDTTLYKRGFESIITAFLQAINTSVNPVKVESSLLSHWICHQINTSPSAWGKLDLQLLQGE